MKVFLKRLVLIFSFIIVSPLIVLTKVGCILKSESFFNSAGCALSLLPGRIGSYMRVAYYISIIKKMSPDTIIDFGSFFSRMSAEVGHNVYIGAYCILGNVTLKNDIHIASRVSIPSGKHQHGGSSISLQENDGIKFEKVTIGNQTWIGEGAIVMADVGNYCIIGSGSVVTRPVQDNTIAVGNPARPIKDRGKKTHEG